MNRRMFISSLVSVAGALALSAFDKSALPPSDKNPVEQWEDPRFNRAARYDRERHAVAQFLERHPEYVRSHNNMAAFARCIGYPHKEVTLWDLEEAYILLSMDGLLVPRPRSR